MVFSQRSVIRLDSVECIRWSGVIRQKRLDQGDEVLRSKPRPVAIKLVLVLIVLICGGLGGLFAMQSRSVLYRFVVPGTPSKEPAYAIFNPFRDRQPERSADEFLTQLQHGDCESAMGALSQAHSPEYRQTTCEREQTYRLMSWKLKNRTDESNTVRLYYEVKRQQYSGNTGQVWVTVENAGGLWRVTRYDRAY